jgi:serine/threonine-protein kinase
MERLPGTTLEDELSGGPLPLGRTRDVAAQLLAALEAAHAAGVIHRDVKPGNVLTCPDGRVKIGDFGIAVALSDARQTSGNLVLGTPAYLAPERIAGKPASPAADLYSLGAVLYRCLTGKRPREGANTVRILAAMAMQRAQPVMELRPEVDRALAAAVDRALDPDPAMRPGSASEMLAMLEGRSQPAGSWRTASRPARHMRAPGAEATATLRLPLLSRRRRIPLLVCAAALVSAGLLIPLSLGPSHVTHRPGRNGAAVTAGENLRGVPQPLRKALGRLDRSISKP